MEIDELHWNLALGLICPIVGKPTLRKIGSWQPEPIKRNSKIPRTYISRDEYRRMGREIVKLLHEGVTDVLSRLDGYDISRKAKGYHLKRYRNQLGLKQITKKAKILHFKAQGLSIEEIAEKTGISLYYTDFIYFDRRRK